MESENKRQKWSPGLCTGPLAAMCAVHKVKGAMQNSILIDLSFSNTANQPLQIEH